jgi:hypothetical protein
MINLEHERDAFGLKKSATDFDPMILTPAPKSHLDIEENQDGLVCNDVAHVGLGILF